MKLKARLAALEWASVAVARCTDVPADVLADLDGLRQDLLAEATACYGCGLPGVHKSCPAYDTLAYCDPRHPAWGSKDLIEKEKTTWQKDSSA